MEFQEQNEYYVVKGWYEKTNGMHQGAFYGAVATPDNYLQPKRVIVNGQGAATASEAAGLQPAKVYPQELLKEQDVGGLNPKEREETQHMLLDRDGPSIPQEVWDEWLALVRNRRVPDDLRFYDWCVDNHPEVIQSFDRDVATEMTGSGAVGMGQYALGVQSSTNTAKFGMSDRGGHGDIDNLSKGKRIKTGRKKGKGTKDAKGLTGFGDKAFMPTISQSGGHRGGNKF